MIQITTSTKDNQKKKSYRIKPNEKTIRTILAFAATYQAQKTETMDFIEYFLN